MGHLPRRSKHASHPTAADFRFDADRHTQVFVCQQVVDGAPILEVAHDGDDDWQFLCGQDHGDSEQPVIWCLEHAAALDPSVNELADMDCNHSATRAAAGAPWVVVDDGEEFIRQCVAEYGWAVQMIEEDDEGPGFAYTVGLHASYGHPELIVFGLPGDVMQALLNICGDRVKSGAPLPLDVSVPEVLDRHDVRFREVRDPDSFREHVGYALWYYQGKPFRLLQLLWPDKQNRFPGDPGTEAWLSAAQPHPP